MKHFLLMLALIIGFLTNLSYAEPGGSIISEKNSICIRVGVYNSPPKVFKDKNKKIVGIFPDILTYIASEEGWNIKYIFGTFEECLAHLEKNTIDIMADVTYTEAKAQNYTFSDETVFLNWGTIYTRKEYIAASFFDLKSKKIAISKGSSFTEGEQGIKAILREFDIPSTIIEVDDYQSVFNLLRSGNADAGVVDRIYAEQSDKNFPINKSSLIFKPQHQKFAFSKTGLLTDILHKRIDFYLKNLKATSSSIYYQVSTHYLTETLFPDGTLDRKVKMTIEEAKWLKNHPVLVLGVDSGFAPFEYLSDKDGYQGIASDFVKIIRERLGAEFRLVEGLSWSETVEKAKAGTIDILPCVGITEERKKYFNFSKPYITYPRVIITQDNTPVNSIEDLEKMKVAVQANSSHYGFLREETNIKPVLYETFQDSMLALSRCEMDAVVGNLATAAFAIRSMNLSNLVIAAHTSNETVPLVFAIRKDLSTFVGLVNRVLDDIPESEKVRISRVWAPDNILDDLTLTQESSIALTIEEKKFLKNHPIIKIGIDPAWPPFEWWGDDGQYKGISSDYVKLLEKRLGIKINAQKINSWGDVHKRLKNRTIDMAPCLHETLARKTYLNFTKPYLSYPVVIITRKESPFVGSINSLSGKKVGAVKGYAYQEILLSKYPKLIIQEDETTLECLNNLSTGRTDAFIGNLAVSSYLIQKNSISNLKVAAAAEGLTRSDLAMGVRSDWPELVSIIDKALGTISHQEKNEIANKWLSLKFVHSTSWGRVIRIATLIIFITLSILSFFLFWNRRLAKEISIRKRIEFDLKKAKDESEKANQAKSVFLANMSHEIRTPMNAILGYTQLMQNDDTLSSEQLLNLRSISVSGEHLLHLINDILEMSKIEAGRIELSQNGFDLIRLLDDINMLFKERAASKGLKLKVSYEDNLLRMIYSDERKLRQILINLLGNAIKFTDEGEVALSVSMERKCVGEEETPGDTLFLTFQVADTGVGIAEEDVHNIFQSFEQTENGRKKEGTGLGLAICSKYLELMGGGISVTNNMGTGSIFTFFIPVTSAENVEILFNQDSRKIIGLKNNDTDYRILVVDDNPTNRDILSKMLKRVGFHVREAEDGESCLKAFSEWEPHIIMMDIRMPVMDGVEATRRVKESDKGRNTIVIAVSASAMDEEKIQVLKNGADSFIRKPFREREILESLREFLNVDYRYEIEIDMKNTVLPLPDTFDFSLIPEELLENIKRAALGGYIKELNGYIDEVSKIDENIAGGLRKLTDNYEYEKLVNFISKTP